MSVNIYDGVVVKITSETNDMLVTIKKATGISKYPLINYAIAEYFHNHKKVIEQVSELQKKSEIVETILKK